MLLKLFFHTFKVTLFCIYYAGKDHNRFVVLIKKKTKYSPRKAKDAI